MDGSTESVLANLRETEMKFKKACDQVVLLNDKLQGLQRRYDKARGENHRSFRYNLRLRLASVEGVRNAYYEYACEKAERIAELRYEVSQLDGDSGDGDSDTDWYAEEGMEEDGDEGENNAENHQQQRN